MRGLIERDRQIEGVWTGYSSALDRTVLKKDRFLSDYPLPDGRGSVAQQTGSEQTRSGQAGNERAKSEQPRNERKEPASSPFASKLKDALKG
jgi:hypothetical protein